MSRHTGFASLPLHGGKAPSWLFGRMVRLSREIVVHIAGDYGAAEVLRRLSDPHWFQAFGCVLGFDWHSSGVTTTVCGAVKEGLRGLDHELGLFACGGKGAASRKTPQQIVDACERLGRDATPLVYASRTAAKVDSAAVQDGYQLYHHAFFFTTQGEWAVVLALAAELIHGTPASTRDPARFAFAHGGKDGTPFPVDRQTYDRTIDVLGRALDRARVDRSEKVAAFRRLARFGVA